MVVGKNVSIIVTGSEKSSLPGGTRLPTDETTAVTYLLLYSQISHEKNT